MKLAVGCSIESLKFVDSREDYFLLYKNPEIPFELEPCYEQFLRLIFKLNLEGKVLFHDKIRSMTLNDDFLEVVTSVGKKKTFHFDECRVYSTDSLVVRCSEIVGCDSRFLVYDWIDLVSINTPPEKDISRNSNFVKNVWFNVSRIRPRQAVSKSILSESQLKKLEYSDTYVKFTLLSLLSELGHTGRKNGFAPTGDQLYLAMDLDCTKREVYTREVCRYLDTERISFESGT